MNDSLYIAASGMQAQQLSIDTVANNLANISTPGFKKSRANFQEMMHVDNAQSAAAPRGIGISVDSVARDFTASAVSATGSPMDIAISGNGFIEVALADGSRGYSRGGTVHVSKDGYLASAAGHVLKPGIHIPSDATAIVIAADGIVTAKMAAHAQPVEVGQLELAMFSNPAALKDVGNATFIPTEVSGDAIFGRAGQQGLGTIAQGALEGSNVTVVDEMVTLMVAQRAYEMSSKVIQTADELMALTNNLRR